MTTLHTCYRFPSVVHPPGLVVARLVAAGSQPVTKKPEVSSVVSHSAVVKEQRWFKFKNQGSIIC